MMASDFLNTLLLLITFGLLGIAYGVRICLKGRAHFDRVEKQGGSVLLGKGLMEMAYWSLQPLARFLVYVKVTPNMLSWSSLVLGGVAGVCLAYGHFGYAAVFATYSAFFDTLDGMVARLTECASDAGEVLDACIDRYVEFFFLAGLVMYYRELPMMQILSLLALIGSFMISYSTAKAEALGVPPPPGIMRRPERAFYLILGAAFSTIPIPWLEGLGPLSPPVAYPMAFAVVFVGLLSNIAAIERFYTIALAIREREAEERLKKETVAVEPHDLAEPEGDEAWVLPQPDPRVKATKSDFRA